MGLTNVKFGKQQSCDNIRSMTINGVTVTGVDFICDFLELAFKA